MFTIYHNDGNTQLPEDGIFYVVAQNGIFLHKDTGLIKALVKVEGISFLKEIQPSFSPHYTLRSSQKPVPIFNHDGKEDLPATGEYYVIAKNGIFFRTINGLYIPNDGISFLEEINIDAKLLLPPLPATLIVPVLLFFRRIYQRYGAEAMVLLYFSAETQKFVVRPPEQTVSIVGIDYITDDSYVADGLQLVGTIHSHAHYSAFHSRTDEDDEKSFDGLHITLGHMGLPYFSVSCTAAINNNRFSLKNETVIDGLKVVEYEAPPEPIVNYVRTQGIDRDSEVNQETEMIIEVIESYEGYKKIIQVFYELILPEGKDYRNYPFPKQWFDVVTKRPFTQHRMLDNSIEISDTNASIEQKEVQI